MNPIDTASPSSMSIQLDGAPQQVAAGTTLEQLIQQLGHDPTAVTTAINGEFVPRSARHRVLESGDQVLCFQPIVGG